ncbi:MAG TPA: kinase/pyrophosphorylase [Thermoanaerobacterales bacterium]|nr:kinase/pyrophosphorylase [Thermoanaerobacterales bacterium]
MLPKVFVVSDSIGETAELVTRAAASQFDSGNIKIRRIPYVTEEEHIDEIIEQVKIERYSIIVATIILPHIRKYLAEKAGKNNIPIVDIMGPMMDAFSGIMGVTPKLEPGLVRRLDEEYFKKIEAVEFAVKYDDGKDSRGLSKADIILIGVSRTSKTPLSMYLAHKRYKVANIPLVPEVAPPGELFRQPPSKIIGLTITPEHLLEIRKERLKSLGLDSMASYASLKRIIEELSYADGIIRKLGCRSINVTNKAVEETAGTILDMIKNGTL